MSWFQYYHTWDLRSLASGSRRRRTLFCWWPSGGALVSLGWHSKCISILLVSILVALIPRTSGHYNPVAACTLVPPVARKASVSLLEVREEWRRPSLTSHQVWTLGRWTASLWIQAWQMALKPVHPLSPCVPRPHGRWAQPWAALSWHRAQQRPGKVCGF